MRIELSAGTDARKLQLDGYERTDQREITASIDQLEELLDRDDITIREVRLDRHAGGYEADVIDEYVRAGVASDYGGKIHRVTFGTSTYRSINITTEKETVVEAREDHLLVKKNFREAILEGPITENFYDTESFEEAQSTVLVATEEKITEHEQTIDNLLSKQETFKNMTPEDV